MGSSSDWPTMTKAVEVLDRFGVPHEAQVVSAHRMPDEMFAYAEAAAGRGLRAIIAGAGGAAHLPGMLAAKTIVPVLGVPVASRHLSGPGLAALDRADAGRCSHGDVRDRRGGRHQRRLVRGGDARRRRPVSSPMRSRAYRDERRAEAAASVLPPA